MIQTTELFEGKEPGSSARVDELIEILDDGDTIEALVSVLTLNEAEAFALLALYQGGKRNQERAQRLMLAWADSDGDAEHHVDRLGLWGIYPAHGFDEGWAIDE